MCIRDRYSTRCVRPKSSSKGGGPITTPNDPIVLWVTAHRPQKPSSRWTKGQSCTNFQLGPLKWGCSVMPVRSLVDRLCGYAHPHQLPHWIPAVNPRQPLRNKATRGDGPTALSVVRNFMFASMEFGGEYSVSTCSIPDDHISPRRSAFFMARSVL